MIRIPNITVSTSVVPTVLSMDKMWDKYKPEIVKEMVFGEPPVLYDLFVEHVLMGNIIDTKYNRDVMNHYVYYFKERLKEDIDRLELRIR